MPSSADRPHGILLSIRRSDRSWPWSCRFRPTVTWPVLLSVVLHGISASPLATRYGGDVATLGDVPEKGAGPYFYLPKLESHLEAQALVGEPRIRLRDLAGRQRPEAQPRQESVSRRQ